MAKQLVAAAEKCGGAGVLLDHRSREELARSLVSGYKTNSRSFIKVFDLAAFREGDFSAIFTLCSVMQIIYMIMLTVLMNHNLTVATEEDKTEKPTMTIILTTALALINLVLDIVVSVVCYLNIGSEVGKYVLFTIGIGPVISTVCIFAIIVLFVLRAPKEKVPEYDNPDTSYAPYIV